MQENHLTAMLLVQKGDLDGARERLERSRVIEQKTLPSGPAFTLLWDRLDGGHREATDGGI